MEQTRAASHSGNGAARGRPQTLPHDEIRRLHAAGLSDRQIAKRLGLNPGSIWRVVHGYKPRNGITHCVDCGQKLTNRFQGSERCRPCNTIHRTSRIRDDGTVRCFTCREWKTRGEFTKGSRSGGLHSECRPCQTARKRAWRAANRDRQRAYDRERRRRLRAGVAS